MGRMEQGVLEDGTERPFRLQTRLMQRDKKGLKGERRQEALR